MLVLPFKMKETTKGGIVLSLKHSRETTSCVTSRISLAMGPAMLQGQRALC